MCCPNITNQACLMVLALLLLLFACCAFLMLACVPLLLLFCACCSFLLLLASVFSLLKILGILLSVTSTTTYCRLQQTVIVTHHTRCLCTAINSIAGQHSETRVQVVNSSLECMLHDDLIVVVMLLLL